MVNSTHYHALGVTPSASSDEIRAAYRRLARILHPDVGGSAELFIPVQAAFEVLSNPVTREKYNEDLRWAGNGGNPHHGRKTHYRPGYEDDIHRQHDRRNHERRQQEDARRQHEEARRKHEEARRQHEEARRQQHRIYEEQKEEHRRRQEEKAQREKEEEELRFAAYIEPYDSAQSQLEGRYRTFHYGWMVPLNAVLRWRTVDRFAKLLRNVLVVVLPLAIATLVTINGDGELFSMIFIFALIAATGLLASMAVGAVVSSIVGAIVRSFRRSSAGRTDIGASDLRMEYLRSFYRKKR